jgi:NDP-4-keto-2,6-dideoxyhexose 3-C-methyltransferase
MESINQVVKHNECRICGIGGMTVVLDLGTPHISDFPRRIEPRFPPVPLVLVQCVNCGLVQLQHTAPRDWMYREYFYKSSINESMVTALGDVITKATSMVKLTSNDTVMDIGANDGTLLRLYRVLLEDKCPQRVGVDPALNLHKELRSNCELIIPDYFPPEAKYSGAKCKIITSIAMFYDLEEPGKFVYAINEALHDNGIWVVQFTDLWEMVRLNAFDNVCHEHLEYYSFSTFVSLLAYYGLHVMDVERNAVNGGSVRYYVCKEGAKINSLPGAFDRLRAEIQNDLKLDDAALIAFKDSVLAIRNKVCDWLEDEITKGAVVDVLGASTKGNTLLQFFGLDSACIRRAIDRSEAKSGRYTAGSWIPIVNEKEGRLDPASILIALPWHFREGLMEREKKYLAAGGRILFPLPIPQVVSKEGVHVL